MTTQSRIISLDNGEPCWNTTSMDNQLVQTGEPLETGHVNQRRPAGNGEPVSRFMRGNVSTGEE